ncbi:hypothetical protein MN116_005808 [Schistosoma mekongi]|uniref:Uncharacterized protein n=1 Tax=Schistosoma mekongi TaxID=38744 RepID=A0AAE1ZB59_SCHME|nr:hypothetical protein MN116_005808 [Schistosoma mekongi]
MIMKIKNKLRPVVFFASMSLHKTIIIFSMINAFILLWIIYQYGVNNNNLNIILQKNNHQQDSIEFLLFNESTDLHVYIVEEHHEVIPYWFAAAKSFENKKAVLLHIDAHSDMDYPDIVDGFPIGHFPQSNKEMETLMQANDEFIQSAILANLIQSVYIIYPYWTFNASYAYKSSLGITLINNTQQICMCLNINNNNKDNNNEEENCKTRKQDNNLNDLILSSIQCPQLWQYHYIELNSLTASNILRYSKYWSLTKLLNITNIKPIFNSSLISHIQHHNKQSIYHLPLILDIDEDFFGVHLVTRSLLKYGLNIHFIKLLNLIISSLFCPLYHINELDIDQIYRWLLEQIYLNVNNTHYPLSMIISNYTINIMLKYINRNLQLTDIFCSNYIFNLQRLHELFINASITYNQFNVLARIGVCYTSSLVTYQYIPEIHLCLGHNMPNASLVEEFVPTSDDLLKLGVQFTQILLSLPYQPNIISIARSSRDGYTPRWLQYDIETMILNILKTVFNLTDDNIIYTKHLAGDKRQGWYRRFTWITENE